MVDKANKYISLFLVVISLIAFIGFGYYEKISDNYLKITENTVHFYLFYLLNSLITGIVYNGGPWLIIPSLFYSLIFFRKFYKRNLINSLILQIVCWVYSFLLVGQFFPFFLGKPLGNIFLYLDRFLVGFGIISLTIYLIWAIDRSNLIYNYLFKELLIPRLKECYLKCSQFINQKKITIFPLRVNH